MNSFELLRIFVAELEKLGLKMHPLSMFPLFDDSYPFSEKADKIEMAGDYDFSRAGRIEAVADKKGLSVHIRFCTPSDLEREMKDRIEHLYICKIDPDDQPKSADLPKIAANFVAAIKHYDELFLKTAEDRFILRLRVIEIANKLGADPTRMETKRVELLGEFAKPTNPLAERKRGATPTTAII